MIQKIIIYCLIVQLTLMGHVFAQEQSTVDISGMLLKMKNELSLTEQQILAIKPVLQENALKRKQVLEEIEQQAITNKAAIKQSIRQLKKQENEQFSKILTEQQYRKWVEKQNLKEKLNQDKINYKDYLQEAVALTPQGGAFQF